MRYATTATPRLMWFNFGHLFSVSLLPLSTAWMAVSELAPQPVAFYALVFFLVNATYVLLIWELVDRRPVDDVPPKVRRIMRVRSIATLCLFGRLRERRLHLVHLRVAHGQHSSERTGSHVVTPDVMSSPRTWRILGI